MAAELTHTYAQLWMLGLCIGYVRTYAVASTQKHELGLTRDRRKEEKTKRKQISPSEKNNRHT